MDNSKKDKKGNVNQSQIMEYNYFVKEMWDDSIFYESGNCEIVGKNDVRIGKALYFDAKTPYLGDKQFYIEGYVDKFVIGSNGINSWTQDLILTRGYTTGRNFSQTTAGRAIKSPCGLLDEEVLMLLSLDLSTACTGWALFDSKTKELLEYGVVKPKVQPSLKKDPILFRVTKLQSIADQLYDLIIKIKGLKKIVIEEIVRGKNRINQKLLDGLHWVILTRIVAFSEIIEFIDVIRWRKAFEHSFDRRR